ncbi:hypothetical protein H7Y40_00685 [Pedobacter sp.]|nr:hypothetical protein [Candidatus Saccharibacteria bacterium]
MKKTIISILLVIVLVGILAQPAVNNALMALLFLGIIPGTNIQIPFWVMFILFFGGGYALLRWLILQPLYIGGIAKQEQTARQLARKKIAKKVRKSSITTRRSKPKKRIYQTSKKHSINRLA